MAEFVTLPSGVKVLSPDPTGSGGVVLNENFELLGQRTAGYTHVQTTPASVWTITHNLGKPVSCTVTDSAGRVVFGDVRIVSLDVVEVSFTSTFAGKAMIV